MFDDLKQPYLTGRIAPLSHELLSILESVSGDFIWLDTGLVTQQGSSSYLFIEPVGVLSCNRVEQLPNFFNELEQALKQGFWLAGWFCYEWGYLLHDRLLSLLDLNRPHLPLACLFLFKKPYILAHEHKQTVLVDMVELKRQMTSYLDHEILLDVPYAQYLAAIEQIKGYIRAGDTYQVNYTLRGRLNIPQGFDALSLYLNLRDIQPVPYGAFMRIGDLQVLSCSPELFFRREGELVITRPMKGTAKRGKTVQEDKGIAQRLHFDIKNRAENIMIVDLLRNDLGRIARTGSVKVPELFCVERYSTLFQMTSTVQARLPEDCSYEQLLRALFPSGSVTGAPKLRTMEIIAELEGSPRGIYTGAIGFISPFNTACFNVAIRTLVMNNRQAELGIGSGVTIGSEPQAEYDECRLKADFFVKHLEKKPDFQLIETMLWDPQRLQDGRPLSPYLLLERHMRRMANSAHYFDFHWNEAGLLQRLSALSHEFMVRDVPVRVRITLSRMGEIHITWQDFVDDKGCVEVPVSIADVHTFSEDVFLYHKTTHRPIYNVEYAKSVGKGHFDCIFLNERNEVTEGAITNIFVRRKEGEPLLTPPVSCGLLNGTLRQELLERGEAVEAVLYMDDLMSANAIFIGNSVRGLKPARLVSPVDI